MFPTSDQLVTMYALCAKSDDCERGSNHEGACGPCPCATPHEGSCVAEAERQAHRAAIKENQR